MSDRDNRYLPPLPELLEEIGFSVIGLATPFLSLQLRTLHYGVEEDEDEGGPIVGLGLFYAQQYMDSPQVLAIESSRLPSSVVQGELAAAIDWSWSNFVSLREGLYRLHRTEPIELVDEDALEVQFQERTEELQRLQWAQLTRKSTFPLLVDMEVARGQGDEILARRFSGSDMLLVVSIGLKPEQFLEAMKQLIVLQEAPKAVLRHQEEFERLTEA